jgi:hypothetical protein
MKTIVTSVFALLLVALCVPALESLRFRIPQYQELRKSEGVASFDVSKEYKNGLPISITTNSGMVSVTCRITSSDSADCVAWKDRTDIDGQHVSILWSEQPIFLWMTEKRAFEIVVNGKMLYTYDDMVARYRNGLPAWSAIAMALVAFLTLFFLIAYLIQSKYRTRT